MIKLFQFPRAMGVVNASPFCVKAEAFLRMAELEYEIVKLADPRKAPKGKLPYIEDDGEIVPDSEHIIAHCQKKYGDTLNDGLSEQDLAAAHGIRRMLDENLYFALLYCRWADPDYWPVTKETFQPMFPPVIGGLLLESLRKGMIKMLKGQGIARHSAQEVYAIGNRDLDAVSNFLGDKPFFLGDRPREIDACVYGHVTQIVCAPHESPMKTHGRSLPNLVDYCDRIQDRFFDDITA
ncbi:MAG TPA: glutathione S-transferase [Rhodospirillaceae bacterium]|nr:glutathione S-transferase [Rhodospirillaceae bacterium]